jgi:uncharacterized membrane protein
VLVAVFLGVYEEIREHMVQAGGAAASHALSVVSAERALGLFQERVVQAVFTSWDAVTDAFNTYYGGTHFLVPAVALAWLLLRHPEHYTRARTALAVITAAAFACFWLYPVAPPRLLPGHFGIVDTLRTAAGSGHLETSLINTAGDQYASMPSLHVAWAVWCALALYPVVRHRAVRVLVVAYPVMTTLVVVATGNHFFLDAVAGTFLACLTWAAVSRAAGLARRLADDDAGWGGSRRELGRGGGELGHGAAGGGDGGAAEQGQRAVAGVGERRDRAGSGAGVVGVGHEQLVRVGRAELAAERAQALGRERGPGGGGQAAAGADGEAVDPGRADLGAGQLGAGGVEQDVAGGSAGGQADGRSGDPEQVTSDEAEARVVAAAIT